ncbi:hypothetical protein [Klebsiella phage YC1]|jgi:hypothetical protein|nr:hypothetical protein [Klebsiella phage YC1]
MLKKFFNWLGFKSKSIGKADTPLDVIERIREGFLPKNMRSLDKPLSLLYDLIKTLPELEYNDYKKLQRNTVKVRSLSSLDMFHLLKTSVLSNQAEYMDAVQRLNSVGTERPFLHWYSGEESAIALNELFLKLLPKIILFHQLNNQSTFQQNEDITGFTNIEIRFFSSVQLRYMVEDYISMLEVLLSHHFGGSVEEAH